MHGWADRKRNSHFTLLMLDDFKLRGEKLHELLTSAAYGSNWPPIEPMPLAEVPQHVIASGNQPAQKLFLVATNIATNQ